MNGTYEIKEYQPPGCNGHLRAVGRALRWLIVCGLFYLAGCVHGRGLC